ncbi:MAG: nucleotidyltransferase family protein [Cytophagales bacterium]|nr:MAG: nucleotidyltransferase family protein [Cytophagales bacterium]
MKNIGLCLLAAGQSKRFGTAKALLSFHSKPMIQYLLEQIGWEKYATRCIVLGAHETQISTQLPQIYHTDIIFNPTFAEGMSTSLQIGLDYLKTKNPHLEAVIYLAIDQPFLTKTLIDQLCQTWQKSANPQKQIIACEYNKNTFGIPTLLPKAYWNALYDLKGDIGAKTIIKQNIMDTQFVSFPEGIWDIDTPEDLQKILEYILQQYS